MMIDAEMYGMMPSAKIVKRRQRAAREHVEHAEDAALLALEQAGEHVRVDPGHRDVRADAEHHQRAEQEQQPPLEIAVAAPLPATGQCCRHYAFGASFGAASALAAACAAFAAFSAFFALRSSSSDRLGLRRDRDRAAGGLDHGARALASP